MRWIFIPLLFLGLALFVLRPNRDASGETSPAIGKPSPRLDLASLMDGPVADRVDSTSQGKVTLLHFWGTWCGPCKMEYPHLSEMAVRLQVNPDFRFLPVSCESGPQETFAGLRKKTEAYFATEGIDSLAYADPQGVTRRSAAERLERTSLYYPTSMLIGHDGTIVGVWEGYTPDSVRQMETQVSRLLEEPTQHSS